MRNRPDKYQRLVGPEAFALFPQVCLTDQKSCNRTAPLVREVCLLGCQEACATPAAQRHSDACLGQPALVLASRSRVLKAPWQGDRLGGGLARWLCGTAKASSACRSSRRSESPSDKTCSSRVAERGHTGPADLADRSRCPLDGNERPRLRRRRLQRPDCRRGPASSDRYA